VGEKEIETENKFGDWRFEWRQETVRGGDGGTFIVFGLKCYNYYQPIDVFVYNAGPGLGSHKKRVLLGLDDPQYDVEL